MLLVKDVKSCVFLVGEFHSVVLSRPDRSVVKSHGSHATHKAVSQREPEPASSFVPLVKLSNPGVFRVSTPTNTSGVALRTKVFQTQVVFPKRKPLFFEPQEF